MDHHGPWVHQWGSEEKCTLYDDLIYSHVSDWMAHHVRPASSPLTLAAAGFPASRPVDSRCHFGGWEVFMVWAGKPSSWFGGWEAFIIVWAGKPSSWLGPEKLTTSCQTTSCQDMSSSNVSIIVLFFMCRWHGSDHWVNSRPGYIAQILNLSPGLALDRLHPTSPHACGTRTADCWNFESEINLIQAVLNFLNFRARTWCFGWVCGTLNHGHWTLAILYNAYI